MDALFKYNQICAVSPTCREHRGYAAQYRTAIVDIWFDVLTLFYHTHYQSDTENSVSDYFYPCDIKSVISIRQRTLLRRSRVLDLLLHLGLLSRRYPEDTQMIAKEKYIF